MHLRGSCRLPNKCECYRLRISAEATHETAHKRKTKNVQQCGSLRSGVALAPEILFFAPLSIVTKQCGTWTRVDFYMNATLSSPIRKTGTCHDHPSLGPPKAGDSIIQALVGAFLCSPFGKQEEQRKSASNWCQISVLIPLAWYSQMSGWVHQSYVWQQRRFC